MKKCPYCAEEIQDEAVLCKHCGKELADISKIQNSPTPQPQNSNTISTGQGCLIIIVICVLLVMFGIWQYKGCSCSQSSSSSVEEPKKPEHDVISAWVMCQQFVKDGLKSPGSADFGSLFGEYQDPKNTTTHLGGGKYRCTGWVDAQNSFGAKIRNKFIVTIKHTGNDNWRLVEGPIFSK